MFELVGPGGIYSLNATGRDGAIGESLRYLANSEYARIGQVYFVAELFSNAGSTVGQNFAQITIVGRAESLVKFV